MCNSIKFHFLLAAALLFSLSLEGQHVLATTSVLQDIAQNIAPSSCTVQTIVPRGMDPHIYEPTPSDVELVNQSDLILMNGLRLEVWIDKLIDHSGQHGKKIIVSQGIDPIENESYENAPDPHAWMDLQLGKIYAKNTKQALVKLMPKQREEIERRYREYIKKMDSLHQWARASILDIPEENRVLITSHDAFQYFGKAYGLELHSVLGLSTDADVQTGDVLKISQILQARSVPAIFVESTINPKLLQQIARDHQVSIGGELFADALSSSEGPAPSYLSLFRHNISTIKDGLTADASSTSASTTDAVKWLSYGLIFVIMTTLFFTSYRKLS